MTASTIHAGVEIDLATAGVLRDQIRAAIVAHPGAVVVVDMAAVDFIDSTGLGVLVGALKQARLADGDLAVANVPAKVMRIFTITGLNKVFAAPAPG